MHLHATAGAPSTLIALAALLAEWPLFVALALTAWQLWRRRDGVGAVRLMIAFGIAIVIEALIGAFSSHPRPFAAGFGPAWMSHAVNNSMPSTHVTLTWIMAIALALRKQRVMSIVLFALGGVLAWARIYVGIHWPADMVGAAVSACLSVALAYAIARAGLSMLYRYRRGARHRFPPASPEAGRRTPIQPPDSPPVASMFREWLNRAVCSRRTQATFARSWPQTPI